MCYTISAKLKSMLKRARHYEMDDLIHEIEKELDVYTGDEKFVSSGFEHPRLVVYTNESPKIPTLSTWGLVPFWVKGKPADIWNKTLNARGETIFEKPSFRSSAKSKRCLLQIDGFFEYHHFKGKKYPFYIQPAQQDVFTLGGLWDEWTDRESGEILHTFSIVTTRANALMSKIHNNPKLPEPRMPFIIREGMEDAWLENNSLDVKGIINTNTTTELKAYTVKPLSGKYSPGNVPEAIHEFEYAELEF